MKNSADKMDAVQRRRKAADMYLKGWSQETIASFLEVSQATVSRDLDEVRAEWRQAATFDFDEARACELQKIDLIEREAWAAWQRSQTPLSGIVRTDRDGARGPSHRSSLKNSHGDPRYLDLVNKCVAQRCLLLALNPAAPPPPPGDDPHEHEAIEVRRERVVATMARLGFVSGAGHAGARPDGAEPGDVRGGRSPWTTGKTGFPTRCGSGG